MTGCVAPDGTWKFDGTVKHEGDEVVPSPTPEVVYVTQTPEVVYVTVTPTPEPERSEVVDDSRVITIGGLEPELITVPKLTITRTIDPNSAEIGQTVKVTLTIKNTGNGTATDIMLDEGTITNTYKDGCPSTIDDIAAGATERIEYDLKIGDDAQSGTREMPPSVLNYKGESGVSGSTESQSNILEIIAGAGLLPEPTPEPTRPPLEVPSGGCEGLDQNVLRRYDHDKNGLIDSNEMETAKIGYESNYEKPSDYAQILYAYEHSCPVWSTVSPTPTPAVTATPEPTFDNPVIVIDPPIYSGVVRKNGEILDIRITPDPLVSGGDLRIEVDVLNTGTTTTCFELEYLGRDPERWIYSGDMETFVLTSEMGDPGDRSWVFELYWDATFPASNVLLQTATADVHCYTQYEVDNM